MAIPAEGRVRKGETFKGETKKRDVRMSNIDAAKSLADAVRTSLGPRGMDKMVATADKEVIITNDGATILNKLRVSQPAAKMLVELSKSQDVVAGDGTTSVVVICGALLKKALEMLDRGIHPTIVSDAFAKAANKASEILQGMSIPVDLNDRQSLIKAANTSLSSKVVSQYSSLLSPIAVDCVLRVMDPTRKGMLDLRDVKVVNKVGGTLDDSELVEGTVFDQKAVKSAGGITRVENAKIALIQFCVSPPKTDIENNVIVSDYAQMDRILKEERNYILQLVKKIKASGCNVLLIQKSILRDATTELSLHYLAKAKIMVVRDIERDQIEFISKTLGCLPVAHADGLKPEKLGSAALVEEVDAGNSKVVRVSGIAHQGRTATVLLRASNKLVLEEAARSLHDALCVVRCLVQKQFLIPGGGAPEVEVGTQLAKWAQTLQGMDSYCVKAFAEALEVVPYTLAENAGLDPIQIVTDLRSRHAKGEKYAGINVRKGGVTNMLEENVVQPLLVSSSAIALAAESNKLIAAEGAMSVLQAAPETDQQGNTAAVAVVLGISGEHNVAVTFAVTEPAKAALNFAAKEFVPSFMQQTEQTDEQQQELLQQDADYSTQEELSNPLSNLVAYYDANGRYLYTAPYDPYNPLASYPLYQNRTWEYYNSAYQQDQDTEGAAEGESTFDQQAYVEAAVTMLMDIFPLYSLEQLVQTFAEQNYDVVATTDFLLAAENQSQADKNSKNRSTPKEKAHSNGKTNGQTNSRVKVVKARRGPNINLHSEQDFPSLGGNTIQAHRARAASLEAGSSGGPAGSPRGSCVGSASTSDSMTAPSVSTPDGSVKDMSVGQDNAVAVNLDATADGSIRLSFSISHDAADTDHSTEGSAGPQNTPRGTAWGAQGAPGSPQAGGSSFLAAARKAAVEEAKNGKASGKHHHNEKHNGPPVPRTPIKIAVGVPRVSTGTAVSQQYKAARSAASDLARTRNMYFMQATQAYLAGNGQLAKELGQKGRELNDQMKSAHAAASTAIYRSRNNHKGAAANFVDLHGLHVKEALDVLARELEGKRKSKSGMQICVGTGSHTKGARARLPGAVENFLQQRQFTYAYTIPGLIQLY